MSNAPPVCSETFPDSVNTLTNIVSTRTGRFWFTAVIMLFLLNGDSEESTFARRCSISAFMLEW